MDNCPTHLLPYQTPTASAAITALVDHRFCNPQSARYGPYTRVDNGIELLPDHLYRFRMLDRSKQPVSLQVFAGLETIGGQLWEQEVRVLLRVSAIGHSALPRILDGGYDEETDQNAKIAFVVTERSKYDLTEPGAMAYFQKSPSDCMRHLGLLADALSVLHGQGLMHRNFWPGAVEVLEDSPDSGEFRLRLARFEMSALVSSFLLRVHTGASRNELETRALFLRQGARYLSYCPPERLGMLFSDPDAGMFESDRSDVYGLGVLAWEWFLGSIPESVLAGEPGADSMTAPLEWARAVREHIRVQLTKRKLATRMVDLLLGMLDPEPRTRLTSAEVVGQITRNYDALVGLWEPTGPDSPRLVMFMPNQSSKTVYDWQWIGHDPSTTEGREELQRFLELELRGASLVYAPDGATRFVTTPYQEKREAMNQAKYVLLGSRGAWFCQPFREKRPFGQFGGDVLKDVLLIKYVTNRSRAQKLAAIPFRRQVSKVEVVAFDVDREYLDSQRKGRPSWEPLMDAVRVSLPKPAWQLTFERAFEWFLDEQEVELRAREYPFVREPGGASPGAVWLRYDWERDRQRIDRYRTGLFALYASKVSRRAGFGDYFDPDAGDESAGSLDFCADDEGRSRWGEGRGRAWLVARLDEDLIIVRLADDSRHPLPVRGWLRFSDDQGTDFALQRQKEASAEFLESKSLMAHLNSPTTIKGFVSRWDSAGEGLLGGADDRVKDMLTSQAFYALHGPPGTGKTTVAAHAVKAFLRAERGARILVSAQSNFALDNLALRILEETKNLNVLAIRVSTKRSDDKVRGELDDYRLETIALRLAREIEARCARRLERRTDPEPVRVLLGRWKSAIETGHLELTDRVRRGANLVFATCSAATRRNVDAVGSFGVYDWVIVEEAAKAWPTELAIPLVRGVRWTLIGDHKQLPAHRRSEVEQLLAECAESDDDDLREHGRAQADYARIFSLFGTLFEEPAQAGPASGLTRPLGRLNMQFRMRAPIAEVVSRSFYPHPDRVGIDGLPLGTLQTYHGNEKDSGVVEPPALAGRALVWLDTEGVEGCAAKGCWRNEGEVELIARLLKAMRPEPRSLPAKPGDEPLAILTPYREQIDHLRAADLPPKCDEHIYSLHEFQGREANVVIASLVRDTKRRTGTAQSDLGLTANPELINVLFSRARYLLVVVGKFAHFRDSGVGFWRTVCATVQAEGRVLPASEVVPVEGRSA